MAPAAQATPCTPSVCSGHGVCVGTTEHFPICFCDFGYLGQHCDIAFFPSKLPTGCSPNYCHDRGICLSLGQQVGSDGGDKICLCKLGFNGLRCENDIFRKTVELLEEEGLFGNQTLANTSNSSTDASLCSPKECSNQGICLGSRANRRCLCNLGFGGQKCESALIPSMCASQQCSGHGICLGTTGWHTCACHPGWAGRRCEEPFSEKRLRMYWARFHRPQN